MKYSAINIAKWFLSKDTDNVLFNKDLMVKNGRTFYVGNARLNKYLHLAQNIHIAKYGTPLFDDKFYAYDNGAVVEDVRTKYSIMLQHKEDIHLDSQTELYLEKFLSFFKNASVEELIELSHEDSEWQEKVQNHNKPEQLMDTLSPARIEEYKKQYADIANAMDWL